MQQFFIDQLIVFFSRKFDNQMISECHVSVDKLGEDPWEWNKYGQKPIKRSPHPRFFLQIHVTFTYKLCYLLNILTPKVLKSG